MSGDPMYRLTCPRCLRPEVVCYCSKLERLQTRTRVVILQHPRERRVPVSTARMVHLSLENSELHYGVDFSESDRVRELCAQPGTYVLFPGPDAVAPETLSEPPRTLIVVDGTWPLAKKVIRVNPVLQKLPRIGFTPRRPSNYRIRKEPADHCVSTIEAVGEVLGAVEGDHDRFDRMLNAFEYMVDRQIDFAKNRPGPVRYVVNKAPPKPRVGREFVDAWDRMVVLYGEANAHPRGTGFDDPGELVHLVASRPSTGEKFEAVVAPRRPLSESAPFHLAIGADHLAAGESVPDAMKRFRAFFRSDDIPCVWGAFVLGLLRSEGVDLANGVDVRMPVMRVLRGRPGGMELAAEKLKAPAVAQWAQGRAGVRIAALESVVRALNEMARTAFAGAQENAA
ncbi:MAG: tRNA-uridine aminocarboxypropyltransferase [Myxococcaceae bacterium]